MHFSQGVPRGIAVDPVAKKVYWAESGPGAIQRAELDGSNAEIVLTQSDQVYSLALDTQQDRIYWTKLDDKVYRANTDGTDVLEIVTGLGAANYIALDRESQKIYWSDVNTDRIQRSNLDGSNVEDVYVGGPSDNPKGITFDSTAVLDPMEPSVGPTVPDEVTGVCRVDEDGADRRVRPLATVDVRPGGPPPIS